MTPEDVSAEIPAEEEERPLSVSALTALLQKTLESEPRFKRVDVLGEISNFKRHSSGHIYFTMKDGGAQVNCVFFKGANRSLDFKPTDGMEVVARGEVKIYPPYGSYQLYVRRLTRSGVGELYAKYEATKKKLIEEGLTAAERKRDLPRFPQRIGIVSSRDSAGLKDALKVLSRRYPLAHVLLEHVNVEGVGSAPSIVGGLRDMARYGRADVVIICRGGGSIESLWGFNTEEVARAITKMPCPVITAVGHETDTTIADLVADRRAATPTEAAELATPSLPDLVARSEALADQARRQLLKALRAAGEKLGYAARTLRSPEAALELRIERLDRLIEKAHSRLDYRIDDVNRKLHLMGVQIARAKPSLRLARVADRLETDRTRMERAMEKRLERFENSAKMAGARLKSASPTAILARGYSVALKNGRAVRSFDEVAPGEELNLRFHNGGARCEVLETEEAKVGKKGN